MVQALGKRLGCLTASGVVSAQGGRMEIHQLKYFICVAKLESISKAATMLHLSQPALSKSLAKPRRRTGRAAVRPFGETPASERPRQALPERRRKGLAGTRWRSSVGQRRDRKPAGLAERRGVRRAGQRHFLRAAVHAGKPADARHARRPSTLDHGPLRARVRHGVLSRRARVRGHCRHSLRTQPRTAGSPCLPPLGSRRNSRPCPIQGRPLRFHEHHGRRVRAKLPASASKTALRLGCAQ